MLFTLSALLFSLPAIAAPLSARQSMAPAYAWTCEVVTHPVTGAYIDQGCGIGLRDSSGPPLCLRTAYDTIPDAPAVVTSNCFAGSPGGFGGRFDVKLGETRLRNMEAATADFCLAANADRTAAVMARCDDADSQAQAWVSSVSPSTANSTHMYTFALVGECLCLTSPGVDGEQLTLAPCNGSAAQNFAAPGLDSVA